MISSNFHFRKERYALSVLGLLYYLHRWHYLQWVTLPLACSVARVLFSFYKESYQKSDKTYFLKKLKSVLYKVYNLWFDFFLGMSDALTNYMY